MHRRVVPPCAASEGYDENRVRRLLDVGRALTCELDEGVVLERVLETARQLTGARYAALGILNEQKTELARFLTLGVDDEAHAAIGDLPRGRGVLGALIDDPRPLRLSDVGSSPDSYGFPAGHPVMRSFLGVPVVVRGEVWGNLYLTEKEAGDFSEQDEATAVILADWAAVAIEPLPAGSEERLAGFTELLRAAIANVESRAGLARLVEEQAALRRVATLVARGAQQEELFAAVAREAGELLAVDFAAVGRYEPDGTVTGLATSSADGRLFPVLAEPQVLGGENVTTIVSQTGHPARIDSYVDASGQISVLVEEGGVRSAVGSPIVVDGRLWGVMSAGSLAEDPLPADIEARLAGFTELVATAIANAESHSELTASRARIVAAGDDARRRIERDLHDGVQQRLVSLGLALRAVQAIVPPGLGGLEGEVARIAEGLSSVQEELRAIAHGIHPAILAEGGLGPALKTLARRCAIAVELDAPAPERLPEHIEVAAYYVVSEALTNAAKHAHAALIQVEVQPLDGTLRLSVRDDGIGGADPVRGSGLFGLKDRVEALGGTLTVNSPAGAGTSLDVELPLGELKEAVGPEDRGVPLGVAPLPA